MVRGGSFHIHNKVLLRHHSTRMSSSIQKCSTMSQLIRRIHPLKTCVNQDFHGGYLQEWTEEQRKRLPEGLVIAIRQHEGNHTVLGKQCSIIEVTFVIVIIMCTRERRGRDDCDDNYSDTKVESLRIYNTDVINSPNLMDI